MELGNIFVGFKNLLIGKVTPEAKKRWEICTKCPNLTPNASCKLCGCYMPAKVKAPRAKCPLKKW